VGFVFPFFVFNKLSVIAHRLLLGSSATHTITEWTDQHRTQQMVCPPVSSMTLRNWRSGGPRPSLTRREASSRFPLRDSYR